MLALSFLVILFPFSMAVLRHENGVNDGILIHGVMVISAISSIGSSVLQSMETDLVCVNLRGLHIQRWVMDENDCRPTSRFSGGFDDRCPSIRSIWLAPLIFGVGRIKYDPLTNL
jgi:hypothetical protein